MSYRNVRLRMSYVEVSIFHQCKQLLSVKIRFCSFFALCILCVNFNFTQSNDPSMYFTHTIKKILFTTRAKSLRPRDRPTLGPAAPTRVCVDHLVREVQLYALVTKTTILKFSQYNLNKPSLKNKSKAPDHKPILNTTLNKQLFILGALFHIVGW